MPKFAANLSLLFAEHAFLDRFEAAAHAGFAAVECQFPYAWPKAELAQRLQRHGLRMVLMNLPAGDWSRGDRGLACDPARIDEFRAGIPQAIAYASALGCPQLNCLAGIRRGDLDAGLAHDTLVQNLRYAAARLAEAGLDLLIEPINGRDVPGFFLAGSDQAAALLDDVGAPNLRIQYDVYHAQRSGGELAATIARLLPRIGHIQIADNPGRHEPGTGEIAYGWLLAHIDRLGYAGWIGCEYLPSGSTADSLAWLREFAEHGVGGRAPPARVPG